jgi:signal transduction histidine kinase
MVDGGAQLPRGAGPADAESGAAGVPTCMTPGQIALPDGEVVLRGVAHDLRCPLTSILLASQVLLLEVGAGDAHRRRRLELIVTSARRALAMTEELACGGAGTLTPGRHDLGDVVREVIELHGPQAEVARVTLRADVRTGPLEASIDRAQLVRAVSNLVGNAIRFSPTGGLVVVAVERRPGGARVLVTDRGPGIPADALARLFLPAAPRDPVRGGLGLGLTIARTIVEAHGGAVGVDSQPGQGSTFWIDLPGSPQEG